MKYAICWVHTLWRACMRAYIKINELDFITGRAKWTANKLDSTLLKNLIFSIHEPSHINHRHVCDFIAISDAWRTFSMYRHWVGGWKAVKRARAMNEMQEYRVLFTPACVQHFCRTLWGEYNNCTILLRHLWSSLVPSILCFAYKKRLPASVNTRIYKTSIFIRKTCAKQFSWFNVYFCRSRLSFGMENSSII